MPAPPDSRGTPWVFTRGTERLPEALDEVHRRTGGLLTYVGEWHSHPMGGSDLSDTDKHAVISLRSILDHVGLPTLVTIVTPDEIRPHRYGANAVWKGVAQRLLDDTCQQRTGRLEEDGCWPSFEKS